MQDKGLGIMGEKVIISIFHQVGLRGMDVYLDDWGKGDGPTQE